MAYEPLSFLWGGCRFIPYPSAVPKIQLWSSRVFFPALSICCKDSRICHDFNTYCLFHRELNLSFPHTELDVSSTLNLVWKIIGSLRCLLGSYFPHNLHKQAWLVCLADLLLALCYHSEPSPIRRDQSGRDKKLWWVTLGFRIHSKLPTQEFFRPWQT